MKAEVVKMTPEYAAELLKKNKQNRAISSKKLKEYVDAMNSGQWKENGESVIIDKNGVFKDGQHRLQAIIKTGKSYDVVLVTDVEPDVMATIDVGKSRTLSDMLKIEGAKLTSTTAATIKKIMAYEAKQVANTGLITNIQGMEYYFENKKELHTLVKFAAKLYQRQNYKLLGTAPIAFYHYVLVGFEPNEKAAEFLRYITGVTSKERSAATWVQKRLYDANKERITLHEKWKLGVVIKAWNTFIEGDPAIRSIEYNIDSPLPEIRPLPKIDPQKLEPEMKKQ